MKREKLFLTYPLLILVIIIAFTTSCNKEDDNNTFTDPRDRNVYKIVTIGNQVWMAENLKYLPSVIEPTTRSKTIPYYYVYGNINTGVTEAKKTEKYSTYGVLYNWPAAMNGEASSITNPSRIQGVCPTGWHLPSDAEWTELTDYLGGNTVAGGKLKETGTTHWLSPNEGATNEIGFTALPGGGLYNDGQFDNYGEVGLWWSSTEADVNSAYTRVMFDDLNLVTKAASYKELGASVRCIRD
jgi:uncharacterized protein (TIGR02145 family)